MCSTSLTPDVVPLVLNLGFLHLFLVWEIPKCFFVLISQYISVVRSKMSMCSCDAVKSRTWHYYYRQELII